MDISTILVAEADNVTRRLINQLLTARGFDVLEAVSPVDAAALIEQNAPQLAIIDLSSDPRQYLDYFRRLAAGAGTPVLATVTETTMLDIPPLVEAGVTAILCKPFEAEQLFVSVQCAIQLGAQCAQGRAKQAQLETALKGQRDTSVAIGLLMERFRLDADRAFEMLRSYARTRRRRLNDLATDIVNAANVLNGPRGLVDDELPIKEKKA